MLKQRQVNFISLQVKLNLFVPFALAKGPPAAPDNLFAPDVVTKQRKKTDGPGSTCAQLTSKSTASSTESGTTTSAKASSSAGKTAAAKKVYYTKSTEKGNSLVTIRSFTVS